MFSRREHGRKVLYKSNKRRCTTVISHVNSNKSNHLNTSNSDDVIGTSNLTQINSENGSPFNTFITLQKVMDIYSSVIINDKRTYQNNMSEEILSDQKISRNN